MNAVAPPGLKPGPHRGNAEDDNVRLTIDYDDVDEPRAGADPLPVDQPRKSDAGKADADKAAKQPRKAGAQPAAEPAEASAASPAVPPQLAAIEVTLSVEIGSRLIPLRDLMSLEPGQLFALDRMTHEPVTILVNSKPFAHGEVVAIGERFGVRLLDLLPGGDV